MPQPTPGDVHVDAILTNMSIAYIQDSSHFVAHRVFPAVPVRKQSDKYYVYNKNDFFRDDAVTKRGPATESTGSGFRMSTDSYFADVWATHMDVDEQTRANADSPLDPNMDATEVVSTRMLLKREREFISSYFQAGVWGTTVVGATDFTRWDDSASDPEKDISDGKIAILKNTGMRPNVLMVSYAVHEALKRHPLIKDRFKFTSSESITEAMLAKFFEIEDYVVSLAVYATNIEGGTEAYDFTAGNNALLVYRNPAPALRKPSAGYIMEWTGLMGAIQGARIKRIPMPLKEAERIEGQSAYDHKLVGADLGYFFSGVIS